MRIVLREDVDNLGDRGQIVNVAPGYARNFLIPKGLALPATPGNLKMLELRRKVWAAREAKETVEAKAFAERLSALSLRVEKKAGESDTLYGSVTTSEIAELLAAEGIEVDRRRIQLAHPIKSLGTFTVPVKIYRQVYGRVSLHVVPEGGAAEAATEAETAPAAVEPGPETEAAGE